MKLQKFDEWYIVRESKITDKPIPEDDETSVRTAQIMWQKAKRYGYAAWQKVEDNQ